MFYYIIYNKTLQHNKVGETIATTHIKPLHAHPRKSITKSISDILDYGKNPEKTDGGRLVSTYECAPQLSNDQFLMGKQIYEQITNKKEKNADTNVLAYSILQSFSPEENMTPEQANKIGMELAKKFTGGNHQIVVCTHIDKAHIHNHIYFNSTSLDCSRKFDNVKDSAFTLRQMSDELCKENGLSIIEKPAEKGLDYKDWLDKQVGIDWKATFKNDIDTLIPQCKNLAELKKRLTEKGYTLRGKKSLSISHPDRGRGMKTDYLDEKLDYSPAGIEYAIKHGGLLHPKEGKNAPPKTSYDLLTDKLENLGKQFDFTKDIMKTIETSIEKIKALQVHIVNYAKTVGTFKAYNSSRHKERFYDEHKGDLLLHDTSVKAFKALKVKKLPKVAELTANLDSLKMQKAEHYNTYKNLRAEIKELQAEKQNLDNLRLADKGKQKAKEQER